MKAKYEFQLPEETAEHSIYIKANELYSIIDDLKDELRALWKYDLKVTHEGEEKELDYDTVDYIYSRLFELCEEHGVRINEEVI